MSDWTAACPSSNWPASDLPEAFPGPGARGKEARTPPGKPARARRQDLSPASCGLERPRGEVCPVARLTLAERRGMYALLQEYFLGVTWERFQADLEEKEWVVLLRCGPQIVGFSTLMRLRLGDLWAFFSGDTIVDRRHRAESELPRAWARHVFHLLDRLGPGKEVWWFLLCAGYKTYRFLPVFFREFYPCPQGDWPEPLRLLRDRLGRARYPQEYDAQAGIVRFGHPTPLRPGVAELTPGRLRDPHVACFVQANPGHARGDELCCLARLSRDNLTPLGRRMLR